MKGPPWLGQDTKSERYSDGQVLISGREYLMEVVAENSRDISDFLILLFHSAKSLLEPPCLLSSSLFIGVQNTSN
jgi:hypothetical protein